MSKIFKSSTSNREVRIWPTSAEFAVAVLDDAVNGSMTIQLSPAAAPALALAILEAAGHRPVAYDPERLSGDDLLAYIAHKLAVHVGDEAKRAKEAADREALEAEALALCNAFQDAGGYARADVMTTHHYDYGKWMDAARKARELHGATK